MAYIELTPAMVEAAVRALCDSKAEVRTIIGIDTAMAEALRAAFNAGEIRSDPLPATSSTVQVTLYDHNKDTETLRVPLGGPAYDLGPRGAVVRKIEVRR